MKASKKKPINLGAPDGAPKIYFIRAFQKTGEGEDRKGKFRYYDRNGNEVSEEKVKRWKRKVYTYNFAEDKIIVPQKSKPQKQTKRPEEGVSDILQDSFFGYDVIKKVTTNAELGRKNYFQFKGKTYYISKGSTAMFCLFFSEIQGQFLEDFQEIIPSPVLLIDYIEFEKNSIFNLDSISFGSKNSDLEGVSEEDLSEEFDEVKKVVSKFRGYVTRKIKEYFNL